MEFSGEVQRRARSGRPSFGVMFQSGANQIGGNRRQGMMGKSAWQTAQARYEALREADGLLPATYRVVLGWAQK